MKCFIQLIFILIASIMIGGCSETKKPVTFQKQHYFYSNTQGNNTIEGDHIYISKTVKDTIFFNQENNEILQNLNTAWLLGQGSGKPYYDTGKEYYWQIKKVIPEKNAIIYKTNNDNLNLNIPVVFWKLGPYPVKANDTLVGSWSFSKIIFDSKDSLYKTHFYECDTSTVSLYYASSKNSVGWKISPLLAPKDFINCPWNVPNKNNKMMVTPLISDIIEHDGFYYSFAYGDDAKEKTYIGLLKSKSIERDYYIIKDPILSPSTESKYSNHDVYYPKVIQQDSSWLMFYTAKNVENEEFICLAKSNNLHTWQTIKENIIPRNTGWNSAYYNQLCSQVKISNDTLYVWATGAKDVGDYEKPNKGNAMDACIGKFYTVLPEINFKECPGNPIFGGNPVFNFENDHVGGSFQEIDIDGYTTTFYHAKGRSSKNYTVLVK